MMHRTALAAIALLLGGPALAQGVAWVSSEKDNALTLIDMGKMAGDQHVAIEGVIALHRVCRDVVKSRDHSDLLADDL